MHYMLFVIDDKTLRSDTELENGTATPEEMVAISAFNHRLETEGHWLYAGGLGSPSTATVIDNRGEETVMSDGPFIESKEFLAGLWIIEAPNLDVALNLAAEGSRACNRRIEVRPFHLA